MNKKINVPPTRTIAKPKFAIVRAFPMALFGGVTAALLLGGYWSWAQTAPVLKIASLGTNGFSITVTNGLPTSIYTLQQTHALGNLTAYPWKFVASGVTGQTNFTVPPVGSIDTEFYQVVATNYTIGSFGMFIDSPVNGANLTQ